MKRLFSRWIPVLLFVGIIIFFSQNLFRQPEKSTVKKSGRKVNVVAVEVLPVQKGPIALHRTFSGTLASRSEYLVAPKVDGRLKSLSVDLSDRVSRGQVVARLDNEEYIQAVAQVEADLAVALASRVEAKNALEIVDRDLERVLILKKKGVSSASQVDEVRASHLAAKAGLEIAGARVLRAEAALETAWIRLGYTTVAAEWEGGDDIRFVAEKRVSPGEMVGANTPMLRLVELNPLTAIFFVTEKDYSRLAKDQEAYLSTDAWPGEEFSGKIARIAPVFDETTRQARVELRVENPGYRLKPGMFVRITVVLDRVENAVIIPETALAGRSGKQGVFLVSESGDTVSWRQVETGIRQGELVQVVGANLSGQVVTLGHQMLNHGSRIRIPEQPTEQN